MSGKKVLLGIGIWIALITVLHLSININWTVFLNERLPEQMRKINVAYIPVT